MREETARWAATSALFAALGSTWTPVLGSPAARAFSAADPAASPHAFPMFAAPIDGAIIARTPNQDGAANADASDDANANANANASASADDPANGIRFSFKQAPFDQVLDFFSRSFGKPVVREAGVPDGSLDYLSPKSYSREDALRILNTILRSRGVVLQETEEFLYLRGLENIGRSDIPTFVGKIPDDVPDGSVVTVVRPLNIAVATSMAERMSEMIASYGSVAAMPQQNALLITETAAQVRRLTAILDELDAEDPEGAIEIIPVRNVSVTDLMEPIQGLLSQKVVKFMVNQKGKQVRVEENELPGLTIAPDERTNSLVAKGIQSRIDKLKEVVGLLDTSGSQAGRAMRTFDLARLEPKQAKSAIEALFATRDAKLRPTIIVSQEDGRITVAGRERDLLEAERALAQLDGGASAASADADRRMEVVPLDRAQPEAMLTALKGLLSTRQERSVRLLAGPDGRSIVVSGSAADVADVVALVPDLDARTGRDRTVRILAAPVGADPAMAIARAEALYARTGEAESEPVDVEFDDAAGSITLIGTTRGVERFSALLGDVAGVRAAARETRSFTLVSARPDEVARTLRAIAPRLAAAEGVTTTIDVTPVDSLDLLQVTAAPDAMPIIAGLLTTLDRPGPGDIELSVVPMTAVADVDALLARTADIFGRLAATRGLEAADAPDVEHDTASRNLIVSGSTDAVALWTRSLTEARRLVPAATEGRFFDVRQRTAADIIAPLNELLALREGDAIAEPEIQAMGRTNQLYVRAEPAQLAVIEGLIRRLDTLEPTDLPPLRLLQVRAADVEGVARVLRNRYDRRPPELRRDEPVTIEADGATNTLVVSAHENVFDDIRVFVDALNATAEGGADRETMIFPLRRARAVDLATALERLYPEPPVPRDNRGRPLPQLQQPREVSVTADPATNTLIVEAPAERRASFEALVERLDRVELPPRAELRTYRVERGDPLLVSRTLEQLARRGVLSAPAEDGGKPVDVIVQVEPRSRTLIIAGDAVTFEETEALLRDLEAVAIPRRLRVFEIPGADLDEVAARAQRLYTEQAEGVVAAGDVSVEVDRDAGALLVVADDEAMVRFAGILDQLRRTIGSPPDVRLIPLNFAAAADVAGFLQELAADHRGLTGETGAPPTFESVDRTNSLLVAATPEQHSIIRELVRSMDRPEAADMPPLRILRLRAAEAGNLAQALTRQYDGRSSEERRDKPVRITADAATNALVVAAHPDLLAEIETIVGELNDADRYDAEGREIRIFPLRVARAEELARTLDEMFPAPPAPLDRRGRPIPGVAPIREIVVRADIQTNSIIVDAPAARMVGFEGLVEQLDRQEPNGETAIRTYDLVHADVSGVAETLRRLAADGALLPEGRDRRSGISIDAEPRTRKLVVSGPLESFKRIEELLAELDVAVTGPSTTLQFFALEHARADAVASMLREILLVRLREELPASAGEPERLIDVSADRATNTLILSAPEALVPIAEQLIQRLDSPAARIGDRTIRVRPLTFADAGEVSQSLGGVLGTMTSPSTGLPLDVEIVPAGQSNAVILVGIPTDLEMVEEMIRPLDDRPSRDAIDARTFALQYAEAGEIADMVRTLLVDQSQQDPRFVLEQLRRSRGNFRPPTPIRVEADTRTNALIVSGPQRSVALAEQLIGELDRDRGVAASTRVYTPRRARPAALATSVRRLAELQGMAGRDLRIEAEPETGSVVVAGPDASVDALMAMLAERDAAAIVAPPMQLTVVPLGSADPAVIASTVQPILRDRGRWPQSLLAASEAGIDVAEPTVTADPTGGRVLVSAPDELAAMARELIAQLDVGGGRAAMDVRVFSLGEADATGVADALQAALTAEAASRPAGPAPTVSAEPSSNSVIVTATAEQLDRVEQLVAGMDEAGGPDRQRVRTVKLVHARAESIAPIVERLLGKDEEEDDPFGRNWFRRQQFNDADDDQPEIRIAADRRLNAVVISAAPGLLATAEEMVRQLDVPAESRGPAARPVQVLPLRAADAASVAETLAAVFGGGDDDLDAASAPVIRVDAESNSLVVRADAAQFEMIRRTVASIDGASFGAARQLRV
ncbi:MAG: secretin N-terminal domain-containing protein, partial [Phycisphaerales bacterium]